MSGDRTSRVLSMIKERPGLTQKALAQALFGPDAYPSSVERECVALRQFGLVERHGCGGRHDPYRYRPGSGDPPGLFAMALRGSRGINGSVNISGRLTTGLIPVVLTHSV